MICSLFVCLCAEAQHMKFMGIDIDGNAVEFRNKLYAKGFKNNINDKSSVPDAYTLIGKYYDEDAYIDIYFDIATHKVYQVSVSIIKKDEIGAYITIRDILKVIEGKYQYKKKIIDQQMYQYDYYIFEGLNPIGMIQTFMLDPKVITTAKEAMVNITYTDTDSYLEHESRKDKDI